MFEALVIGCLLVTLTIGGKAILTGMTALPVIGDFAGWYAGVVGSLSDGIVSNVIYGAMVMQIILLPLGVLLYGPGLVKRLRKHRQQQPTV